MIKEFDLTSSIKLVGWLPQGELHCLYGSADVTVVPSYSEGGPLNIPESLACGVPVVATDVGGSREYLYKVNLREYLVKIDRYYFSLALARKIGELLQHWEVYHSRRREFYDKIHSWIDLAREYVDLFKRY